MGLQNISNTVLRASLRRRKLAVKTLPPLQRSIQTVSSLSFDDIATKNVLNIPRLPIPPLETVIDHYSESVKALALSEEDLNDHEQVLQDFLTTDAPKLYQELVKLDKDNASKGQYPYSFIESDWDAMYLEGRWPVAIHSNPAYVLQHKDIVGETSHAAKFVTSILRWQRKLVEGKFEPDAGRSAQCLSQYAKQFGTTRIPMLNRDILQFSPRSSHITVICGPRFYSLRVLDDNGKRQISETDLAKCLQKVLEDAQMGELGDEDSLEAPLGVLTSQERDRWARHRQRLAEYHEDNRQSLRTIDDSLLVLVLDPTSAENKAELGELALHGKGDNRWFDKLQVIATGDGALAVNFEHSFSDGMTWNRWLGEVWKDMGHDEVDLPYSPLPGAEGDLKIEDSTVERLKWKIPKDLASDMVKVAETWKKERQNLQSSHVDFEDFGKNEIKKWKVSPDAVVQMALQLSYWRKHHKIAPTYESCAMRHFLHGRTETIRSATNESLAFVQLMSSAGSRDAQREAFLAAAGKHVEVAKKAQGGEGCDRVILALSSLASKMATQGENHKAHPFFSHPIKTYSSTWRLSTSNVSAPFLDLFTFGPVAGDGYGVGYLIQDNLISGSFTAFREDKNTDSEELAKLCSNGLREIKDLFQ